MANEQSQAVARPWLRYTGLRLLVFLASAVVLAVVGLNGFPLLVAALFVSMVVSSVVLRRQREEVVAAHLARREQRAADRARLDEA